MKTLADHMLTVVAFGLMACITATAAVFVLGTAVSEWCERKG